MRMSGRLHWKDASVCQHKELIIILFCQIWTMYLTLWQTVTFQLSLHVVRGQTSSNKNLETKWSMISSKGHICMWWAEVFPDFRGWLIIYVIWKLNVCLFKEIQVNWSKCYISKYRISGEQTNSNKSSKKFHRHSNAAKFGNVEENTKTLNSLWLSPSLLQRLPDYAANS